MAIFNGSAPAIAGENIDHVQLYPNGGVGALGQMGAPEAAVRAERWAWVVVTRAGNEMKTYVNGRLCAKVDVTVKQPKKGEKGADKPPAKSRNTTNHDDAGGFFGSNDDADAAKGGDGGKGGKDKDKDVRLPERMCIDPQHLALFAPACDRAGGTGECEAERGLALRYVQLATECWDAEGVRKRIESLRAKDDEAELIAEADVARFKQLSLQPLYARPPPVWLHPAFAAEFGDAFIAGTGLESSTIHVSLEVVVLAMGQMLRSGGPAESMLEHAERAALNGALASLVEAQRLAHKLAHALGHDGQQRMYLSRVKASIDALEPGGMLPIPCHVGGEPLFVLVRRGTGGESAVCTLAIVSCQPEGATLSYHRCEAAPPKIRYETSLELRNVSIDKLKDEALWTVIWFAGAGCATDGKLQPAEVFYQICLSYLANDSLTQGIIASDELREADDDDDDAHGPLYRTPRRSKSAHYGVVRHALNYMLHVRGVSAHARKIVSLLLRAQLVHMADHDLGFVRHVSTAERAVLGLACRQLAYKATKMGRAPSSITANGNVATDAAAAARATSAPSTKVCVPVLAVEQLTRMRIMILDLQTKLKGVPGSEPEAVAPPPLILCEGSSHLARPGVKALLGIDSADAPGLVQAKGASGAPLLLAADAEPPTVVGLYFSASWCPACKTATPLVAGAYSQLRQRGKSIEIIYISLDKEASAFEGAHAGMPWPALPFGGTRAALLAELYGIQAIPSLVLLRADGALISTDGVRLMRKHARAFPWQAKSELSVTPHHHPLYERLLRPHPVDSGLAHELPSYSPIDMLQLPIRVTSLAEATDAVRHCDRLATLIAVQAHSVKNTRHLIVSLVQHTFTQLLPMPRAVVSGGLEAIDEEGDGATHPVDGSKGTCVWREPMEYADQLDLLILFQRIIEHFAASVFSLDHTRSIDAVRMVVPACIGAISDCVMRQRATDIPSEACTHLQKFALSTGWLAKQSATIPVTMPELNLARAAALDYFAALDKLPKIFEWHRSEKLDGPTGAYLRAICIDVAFPADSEHLHVYLTDPHALLMKNYPEVHCYRDIAFYLKLMCNPDARRFPGKTSWKQRDAELVFQVAPPPPGQRTPVLIAKAFSDTTLLCRPKVKRGEMPPTHRFVALSAPSEYTRPHAVEHEDDVLHMWELPDFSIKAASGGGGGGHGAGALGQHDAELLLSYLTVPYLRIPLVVAFFASDDRIHSLQSRQLQNLLDAVLLEPGNHLPLSSAGLEPVDVPTSAPTLLGTPHHLLLNELSRSPDTLIGGVLTLARQACDLDTGTLFSSTAPVILYVARLCARVDNYLSLLIAYDAREHESIVGQPYRGVELGPDVRAKLDAARVSLRGVMWGELRRVLLAWYQKLVHECEAAEDDHVLDVNTAHMCNLHAHLLLMLRNATPAELSEPFVSTVVCGMVFLSTRHEWNHNHFNEPATADATKASVDWHVPENELFETLHVLRRKLVLWLREHAPRTDLDAVMDRVLRVSASTGSMGGPKPGEELGRWAYVAGTRSMGRFARHSLRNGTSTASVDDVGVLDPSPSPRTGTTPVGGPSGESITVMEDDGQLAIEVDVQVMQLTLKASHPQALPDDVAQLPDLGTVFGDVSMQACLTEQTAARTCFRIVGRCHDIEFWPSKDDRLPQLDHFRAYYPEELYPHEKAWLPAVLEPVKAAYLTFPEPLQIFLPEDPLPDDAQVAYLVGKQPEQGGVWREIFVYRERRMVQIYRIESHGRRFYRSLEYASDARFCLRGMQPSTEARNQPWPTWARHEAGHPYASSYSKSSSAVITRDWTVEQNLSLGTETFIPARLLWGLLPQALLDEYTFWQDEADQLRGYRAARKGKEAHKGAGDDEPLQCDDVLLVRLGQGGHVALYGARHDKLRLGEHALTPTRALVLRLKAARLMAQRASVVVALEALETFLRDAAILEGPFEPSFATCQALLALLSKLSARTTEAGGDDADANCNDDDDDALIDGDSEGVRARLNTTLKRLDLSPFHRRRAHHRTAAAVVPALVDAAMELLAADAHVSATDDVDTLTVPSETAEAKASAASASEVESSEMVLLDLLHAPEDSYLFSLASLMARIENLSHVLAWARFDESTDLRAPSAVRHDDLYIVSLPRLKLTFQARKVDGVVRLYSVDHADMYVTNERSAETTELLAGLPHSLLLSNSNGEISVLVPAVRPVRPLIRSVPFSTELVLDRADASWAKSLESPYYLYPVHVSLCFCASTTLASALYLLLLRFLNRQYRAVMQLVDSVASDTDLTAEEAHSLHMCNSPANSVDAHPDAHACRLKISLVMLDSPVSPPWDLTIEMSNYVRKLPHVSANCRLTPTEELTLLGHCVCDPADRRFDPCAGHTTYKVLLSKNRRSALRAALAIPRVGNDAPDLISCPVSLPGARGDNRWIYEWQPALTDGVSDEQIAELLGTLSMKYQHQRALQLDSMLTLLGVFNSKTTHIGHSIGTGAFLLLYNLFQGATQCRVSGVTCSSQSFATLLLPFFANELAEPTLLNALLLTLARTPTLGPFLPPFVDTRKSKRREIFTGLPLPDEENAPLGTLVRTALTETAMLGAGDDAEVAKTMLTRRIDVLTKERMWGGFGGGFGGGSIWGEGGGWGGGWGSGGWGGATVVSGTGGGLTSYQRLEQLAQATEKQCADELAHARAWRALKSTTPPKKAPRVPSTTCNLPPDAIALKLLPAQVSDHSCAERRVRSVHGCTTEQMHALCHAPLIEASARWCTTVSRDAQGAAVVSDELGFDVSAHPDAASQVAKDMQSRLAADAQLVARQINASSAPRVRFSRGRCCVCGGRAVSPRAHRLPHPAARGGRGVGAPYAPAATRTRSGGAT